MHIAGLDDIDNAILTLLKEDARMTYSDIADKVGISRVAVKNRISDMEEAGLIRGYTVMIAPGPKENKVEFIITIVPSPVNHEYIVSHLSESDLIKRVVSVTGECKIIAFGEASNNHELNMYYDRLRKFFEGVRNFNLEVVTSTYKDVDGGIKYEKRTDDTKGGNQ